MTINDGVSFGKVGAFRFWCQKVLPAVYDDSLSYYELLCKVVDYLNKVIDLTNTQSDAITELQETLEQFMSGQFDDYIQEIVDEWFEEHGDNLFEEVEELKDIVEDFAEIVAPLSRLGEPVQLGVLSTFRFALNPPSNFDVAAMFNAAADDFVIFANHHWTYMPQSTNMRQSIPLYFENPYRPNTQGEHVTCSGMVQDVLYRCGYTDLEGVMLTGWAFINYLKERGWTQVDDFTQAQPGAIVFQGARSEYAPSTDDGWVNIPSHDFILVSYDFTNDTGQCYDAGKDSYIQSGGQIQFKINDYQGRGYDILSQLQWAAVETGYYTFYAPWPYNNVMPYETYVLQPDPTDNRRTIPKADYYCYQGYTIKDKQGNIFQHFECPMGKVSQYGNVSNYIDFRFRLQSQAEAIPAEYYNLDATTITTQMGANITDSDPNKRPLLFKFNNSNNTAECTIRSNKQEIEPQFRGLWLIEVRVNFASSTSNTGIVTVAVYEGESGHENIIGIAHAPATDASPTICMTLLETISPNDNPITVRAWGGGLTNDVTIRTNRYNTCVSLTRLR